MKWKAPLTITVMSIAMVGCASFSPQAPTDKHVSAYIEPYSPLVLMDTERHGNMVTRDWVSSNANSSNYDSVTLAPVGVTADIKRNSQVTSKTLTSISQYIEESLLQQMSGTNVAPHPNKTLKANVTIVGLETRDEAFRYYEYLPIGIVLTGGSKIVGIRDEDVNLFILTELSSTKTGEILSLSFAGLVAPERLENNREPVTLDLLKPTIDHWIQYQVERINRY